jgi:hypothetical protein
MELSKKIENGDDFNTKYTDQPARQEVIFAACIGFREELFSRGDRSDSMELCKNRKWR